MSVLLPSAPIASGNLRMRAMNMNSFDLDTDAKIRSFAVVRQCTLAQVKRAIELVGADAAAVNKYLSQRGLTHGHGHKPVGNAVGWY
jgi:uncharacterized protein